MYTDDSDSNQTASTSFMPNCEHTAEQERAEGISFSEKYGCFDPGKPTRYDIGNDIGVTRKQIDEEDCLPTLISQAMYLELVRNLNRQQKEYFYHVLHWFKTKSDPMYIFLSGGAGVGKSVLTRAIYQALLRCLNSSKGSNPDDIKILLCAPTGKAAHNINGHTIHSTFCIPVGRGFDYKPLHMEQLNVFRAKYQKLRVILIDEISMVGCRMLNFINCRLQEIMGVQKPFGGVSMIAIGDLFQLKPVMDSWIFAPRSVDCGIIAGNLWQDNFKLFELTQIMRQKDDIQFAELLNRLREGLHTQADIEILKSKQLVNDNTTNVFSHLYTSRKEVELFNEDVFTLSCNSPSKKFAVIESLDAVSGDLEESKHASVLEKIPIDASKTMGLLKFLKIAEGLTADISININVEDGLTNGASGIIKCIDHRVANSERCSIIWMLFNDPKIGVEQRNQYRHLRNQQIHENWTPIFEVNRKFHLNSNHPFQIIRRQFPLHLAAARTIHKAQGSSLDDVVVHFGQRKWDHMHYVGLSRVRSLAGLHILHLNEEKIAVNPEVIMEMDRLRSSCSLECCIPSLSLSSGTLTLVFHNSRSLHLHFQEMQEESNLTKADIIGISETRLSFNDRNDMYNINGFKLYRNDSVSFGSTRPYHGSAVFSRLPISNTKNLLFRDMLNIAKVKANNKPGGTPYQVPLKVQVAAVAATHNYIKDGQQKSVTEIGLADGSGIIKAICWDDSKLTLFQPNATILLRNYINRDGNLQITSTTKISKSQGLGLIPDDRITQARDLVIFRAAAVCLISEAKMVPVGQLTSLAGKVILDESKVNRIKNNGDSVVVRSVRIQDKTGQAKISLWGTMADLPTPVSCFITIKNIKVNNMYKGEVTFNSTSRTEIQETAEPPEECQVVVDGYYEEDESIILVCKLPNESYEYFYCSDSLLRDALCPGGEDVLDTTDVLDNSLPLSTSIEYTKNQGKNIISSIL